MTQVARAQVPVEFRVQPGQYRHWRLQVDGPVATLALDVREDGGLVPGYELKLNSYDLGVDIELADVLQRLRFEHPEVRAVVLTSGKERVFSAGANIRMLAQSSHGWKVNFCKFTNETRNAIEEASRESGQAYLCAITGPCAGGGYELALATDYIVMADDGSTTVALPEVPLLAVLPGPGGLLLHAGGGHQGPARAGMAAGRRGRAANQARRDGEAPRGRDGRGQRSS